MKATRLLLAIGLTLGTGAAIAMPQDTPAPPAPAAAPAATTAPTAAKPMHHRHHRHHRKHKAAKPAPKTDDKTTTDTSKSG